MGIITRAITDTGVIRAMVIDGTDMVEQARLIHHTSPVATAALGRTLLAASLMGSMLKSDNESITLRIVGDGPLGKIFACSDASGCVRGLVANPSLQLPLREDGKLDVGGAVGHHGFVAVSKDLGTAEPYVSQVPLVSGEIAEDITSYYAVSEQTGTACALGVLVGSDGSVKAAGGYIIQLLPNVYEDEVLKLEESIRNAPPITTLMSQQLDSTSILQAVMTGFTLDILDTLPVSYRCNCSKERVEKALAALGRAELLTLAIEIKEKGETAMNIDCEFCDRQYSAWFEDGNIIVT